MCLPRMDSPSVFGSILDRDAGSFRVGPADVNVPAGRRYVPGTMVLETSWETRMGWVIVRDALSVGPWHHEQERSHSHRRSPSDHDADHVMLRLDPVHTGIGRGQARAVSRRLTTEDWPPTGLTPTPATTRRSPARRAWTSSCGW